MSAIRRTSLSSTSNEQSELTKTPPTVYRLAKINVPDNLVDMTKTLHGELQKIEQSQSVILSIWQKVQSMLPHSDSLEFKLPVTFDDTATFGDVEVNGALTAKAAEITSITADSVTAATDDLYLYGTNVYSEGTFRTPDSGYFGALATGISFTATGGVQYPIRLSSYASESYQTAEMVYNSTDSSNAVQANAWFDFKRGSAGARQTGGIAAYCGNFTVNNSPITTQRALDVNLAILRAEIKAEIYAELLALNPGIVIPE